MGWGGVDAGPVQARGPRPNANLRPLCCRAASGGDSEADVVHLQAHALGGGEWGGRAGRP